MSRWPALPQGLNSLMAEDLPFVAMSFPCARRRAHRWEIAGPRAGRDAQEQKILPRAFGEASRAQNSPFTQRRNEVPNAAQYTEGDGHGRGD